MYFSFTPAPVYLSTYLVYEKETKQRKPSFLLSLGSAPTILTAKVSTYQTTEGGFFRSLRFNQWAGSYPSIVAAFALAPPPPPPTVLQLTIGKVSTCKKKNWKTMSEWMEVCFVSVSWQAEKWSRGGCRMEPITTTSKKHGLHYSYFFSGYIYFNPISGCTTTGSSYPAAANAGKMIFLPSTPGRNKPNQTISI